MEPTNENTNQKPPIIAAYAKKNYIFLGINAFCFIILFLVLDERSGSLLTRIIGFVGCSLLGGLGGVMAAQKRNYDLTYGYKFGAGAMLLLMTLVIWSNKGYKPTHNSNSSTPSSTNQEYYNCPHCDGKGTRQNEVTGDYKSCSSCGGDGRVTQDQFNRLSN